MSIHQRVLEAARRICRERGKWTFGPREVVAVLPDLNTGSVRTHVMSRCCVNAPAHHAHRWSYFRRVRRGVYEILPGWRRQRGTHGPGAAGSSRIAAPAAGIEVEVRESGGNYVAEVRGRAGKFRGASLDEVAALARAAGARAETGSQGAGHVHLRVALEPERTEPVIEAYAKDIDRTLIRQNLKMGFEERLLKLAAWMGDIEELRGAAQRPRGKPAK